ncbi:MAG: GNAT family N-acetyltransferase [Alphaproteobacteria bacterium]|nr:GNAT family N-acetyltransferase [Alphaproteobacteria bacterium]
MSDETIVIRQASLADIPALRAMQALSARRLCVPAYTPRQVESFIAHGTMDESVVEDGTFFLAAAGDVVVGSAGWSTRVPGYAARTPGIAALAAAGRPRVRSVFVHPDWARRGIARRLMHTAEGAASACGHRAIELAATLSGVPLYRALGYATRPMERIRLPDGVALEVVPMTKELMRAAA